MADPAGSGVIVSAVRWLQGTLLGTVATVVAVIAVASVGFLMLTGRINWRYGATVILGCFILFGAASIVAGIQSTASLGQLSRMNGLERDTLFVALTRPQMFAGVTYCYFIANAVIATELFLIFKSIWVLARGADRPSRRRDPVPARAALLRSLADPGQPHARACAITGSGDATPTAPDPRPAQAAAREKPAGHHLPYARHVDDHTIETRDGLLMQVIHLRGLLFETADTDEINYRKRLRDAMLQAIGSSRFALYHHVVRRRIDVGARRRPSPTLSRASSTPPGGRGWRPSGSTSTNCS